MDVAFDIPSVLIATALANAFCAGARLLLWRMHPAIPGLGRWATAGALGTLALLLILSYGYTNWTPSLSLAQLCVVLGLVLTWDGFRRFIGRTPLSSSVLILIAVLLLLWLGIARIQDSMQLRAMGNAVVMVILSGMIARELLTATTVNRNAIRVTGWFYVINALIFLLRTVAADLDAEVVEVLNPAGFAAGILMWWLCMTIAVTLGMVLMTTERLQADLDRQANRDPLTGALNRRAFAVIAEKALASSRRSKLPLTVLIMDLDNFKQVNDRLGHEAGDALLRRFVASANQIFRGKDVFCRYGGEEFVALLPNTTSAQGLVAAERLRSAFAIETAKLDPLDTTPPLAITVSVGIAEHRIDEDIEGLLRRADAALYLAKEKGRNRCEIAHVITN